MQTAKDRLTPLKRRKITPPPINDKLLLRAALVERLHQHLKRRLTIVAAPPGSGKTELVQLWRAEHPGLPLAWYNLDTSDNQTPQFLRYLTQAVIDATGTKELLPPTGKESDFENLIDFLHLQQPELVICIDNLHEIQCNDLLISLANCIYESPQSVHWMLLSQQKPLFDLTELQLKDEVTELGSAELNFSKEEIELLIKSRKSSNTNAETILDNTRGWIAGVNLSLATNTLNSPLKSEPSQKTVDLFQHLAANRLPESVFELIQSAKVCNPINADLADRIGSVSNSQQALDYLIQNCLFIQPLDQQENWFHIHPLFFVAFKEELLAADDTGIKQRHTRAGVWLIEHQIYELGLTHLELGEQTAKFDEQLTTISEEWLLNGNLSDAIRWSAKVDSDRLFGNSKLFLQYLLSLTLNFQVSEATQLLKVYDRLPDTQDENLSVARQLVSTFTQDSRHISPEENEESRQRLLLKANKTPLENFVLGTLTNLTSLYSYLSFRLSDAKAFANEGKRYHRLADSIHGESYSEYLYSAAQFTMGFNSVELAENLETFIKVKHLQQSRPCYILTCVAIAPLYYELNQHTQVNLYCQTIAEEVFSETHLEIAIFYHLTYAKILHREKKKDQSERLLSNMLNHPSTVYSSRAITIAAFERLRQTMIDKDPQRAKSIYEKFVQDRELSDTEPPADQAAGHSNNSDLQNWGLNRLVDAIFHYTTGNFPAAHDAINRLRTTISLGESKYILAIISALEISIDWKNSQQERALDQLSQLIETLNQQGYYCLLRDHVIELEAMIEKLADRVPTFLHPGFKADLRLRNAEKKNENTSNVQPLLEALTKRELVLLIDISEGLSNQEISDKRFVAISTVKWHLKNIYAKLDAKHRAQAIARARELGLID